MSAHAHDDHADHGHVIVPWQILLGVLLVLLVLTVATVATAQLEIFVAGEWGWELPSWLNIAVAMSIATVKGTLVALYFMQLRYDKGVNSVIMLFTLFAVTLFLMFTMIDLGGRGRVTEWRAGEINPGATNLSDSIVGKARAAYIAKTGLTEDEYWEKWQEKHDAKGHAHNMPEHSTANHAVQNAGLTPGLFTGGVWAEADKHSSDKHDSDEHGSDDR